MKKNSVSRGFTLVESVIALGILVVLITGFLAVFGPAAQSIRKTISIDEASRLEASLEAELSNLRQGSEENTYSDSFDKAFEWISQSNTAGQAVIIYKYRAIPGSFREDGSLTPAPRELGKAGVDYIIVPSVRRLSDDFLQDDLDAVEGRVFFVKMRQLIFEDGKLRPSDDVATIVDPFQPGEDFSRNSREYPEALLAFEAEYYSLPSVSFNFLSNSFDPQDYTRPVFARKLGINR